MSRSAHCTGACTRVSRSRPADNGCVTYTRVTDSKPVDYAASQRQSFAMTIVLYGWVNYAKFLFYTVILDVLPFFENKI